MSSSNVTRESNVTITRQVYRGVSPSSASRLESRLREMEDILDLERDARTRAERNANEYAYQLEQLAERLEEAGGLSAQQRELMQRRDHEVTKLRKDLEFANANLEVAEGSMRKKHMSVVAELNSEVEILQKGKTKAEKEKNSLLMEIDNIASQLDSALKAKASVESKLDGFENQLHRFRSQNEDLQRQVTDLSALKGKLSSENFELQKSLQEYEANYITISKSRASLQSQLEDMKKNLDDESRSRINLQLIYRSF